MGIEEGSHGGDNPLEILCQLSVAFDPGELKLDHRSSWQDVDAGQTGAIRLARLGSLCVRHLAPPSRSRYRPNHRLRILYTRGLPSISNPTKTLYRMHRLSQRSSTRAQMFQIALGRLIELVACYLAPAHP